MDLTFTSALVSHWRKWFLLAPESIFAIIGVVVVTDFVVFFVVMGLLLLMGGTVDVCAKNFFILSLGLSFKASVPPRQVERQYSVLPPFLSLKVALFMCPGFLSIHLFPQ